MNYNPSLMKRFWRRLVPLGTLLIPLVTLSCGAGGAISSPSHGQTFQYSYSRHSARSNIQLYVESLSQERALPPQAIRWSASNDGMTWVELGDTNPLTVGAADLADKIGVDLPHGYWTTVMIRAEAQDDQGRDYVESVAIKLVHDPEID